MKNLQPPAATTHVSAKRHPVLKALSGIMFSTVMLTSSAFAADSVRAWGSSSNTNMQLQASSSYHQVGGQTAQIVNSGGETRITYKTVTTCGVCTYNTNTGNNNTIDGNSVTSTNSGSVTSTATFTETSLITTTTPLATANSAR